MMKRAYVASRNCGQGKTEMKNPAPRRRVPGIAPAFGYFADAAAGLVAEENTKLS